MPQHEALLGSKRREAFRKVRRVLIRGLTLFTSKPHLSHFQNSDSFDRYVQHKHATVEAGVTITNAKAILSMTGEEYEI